MTQRQYSNGRRCDGVSRRSFLQLGLLTSLGSLVAEGQGFNSVLPPYVAIPGDAVGGESNAARSGFLPRAFSAFNVGNDATRVMGLQNPEGIDFTRTEQRREMLRKMDAFSRQVEASAVARDRDAFYEQAYRLLSSSQAKTAFDL